MTRQAENCISMFRGNAPATIEKALRMQKSSIVNELKEHYGSSDIGHLALRLSLG